MSLFNINRFSFLIFLLASLICIQCKQAVDQSVNQKSPQEDISSISIVKLDSLRNAVNNDVLLDVRSAEEIAEGMIQGAINLDYYADDFETKLSELDKSQLYLVYCRSGNRSGKTVELMKDLGFSSALNLDGGYDLWKEQNLNN